MINELLRTSFSGKELDIYEASLMLFAKYGINKVTVNELCSEAEVSKMTFYKYFKNKKDLALRFIKLVFEEIKKRSLTTLNNEEIDSKTRFIQVAIDERSFLKELGDELLNSILIFPEAQVYFEAYRDDSWSILTDFIVKKQAEGVLNSNFKPELLRFITSKVWEMIANEELRSIYPNIDAMVADRNEILFLGILKRDQETPNQG